MDGDRVFKFACFFDRIDRIGRVLFEGFASFCGGFDDGFGCASEDDFSAIDSRAGAEVNEVVGGPDDIEVVFDDE